MKEKIHPSYNTVKVVCACGNTFETGTTKKGDLMRIDICNECHPYYTGKQKVIEAGGRVDKFRKRFNLK